MTASRPNHPTLRSAALGALALALAAVACEMPVPVEVVDEESPEGRTVEDASVMESPGGTFRMRGDGDVLTRGQPLVIVDGERIEDGVSDLDPVDIENIQVIKGPTALEQYGEEAADGVIVIETKAGAEGG